LEGEDGAWAEARAGGKPMLMGTLLIAMMVGGGMTAVLLLQHYPLWLALLAYPLVGSITLLLGLGIISLIRWFATDPSGPHAHLPVARSTTPTVATKILKSVANDKLRS
jgi:hypothetical protein